MEYLHGYSIKEYTRLKDQALTLTKLLHYDTKYPSGSKVLEAGCGNGAQTITLAQNSPDAIITSVDISEYSISKAEKNIKKAGLKNVKFQIGDIYNGNYPLDTSNILCYYITIIVDKSRG